MFPERFFITIFLLTSLGFSLGCIAHGKKSPPILYPYRHGHLRGYCTEQKKLLIPAIYIYTAEAGNYYLCQSAKNGSIISYNEYARPTDTAWYIYGLANGSILTLNPYEQGAVPEHITPDGRIIVSEINSRHYEDNDDGWVHLTPAKCYVRDSSGHKTFISDSAIAFNKSNFLIWVKNKGMQGIYDPLKQSWLIAMTTDAIKFIGGRYFLATGDNDCYAIDATGKRYIIPAQAHDLANIYEEGRFFETAPADGHAGALYLSSGTLVMDGSKEWHLIKNKDDRIIGFSALAEKDKHIRGNVTGIYDSTGHYLRNVYGLQNIVANTFIITTVDSGENRINTASLYDLALNKVFFSKKVHNGHPAYANKQDLLKTDAAGLGNDGALVQLLRNDMFSDVD